MRHMAWCEAIDFAEYIIKAMVTIRNHIHARSVDCIEIVVHVGRGLVASHAVLTGVVAHGPEFWPDHLLTPTVACASPPSRKLGRQ